MSVLASLLAGFQRRRPTSQCPCRDSNITSAAGDNNITSAAGDRNITSAAGDNNITSAAGDSNITSATGDSNITSATGDGNGPVLSAEPYRLRTLAACLHTPCSVTVGRRDVSCSVTVGRRDVSCSVMVGRRDVSYFKSTHTGNTCVGYATPFNIWKIT